MDAGYFHLVLNHIPVLGVLFGMFLHLWAILCRSAELRRVSLWVFVIAALSAAPVFLTGEPAEDLVKGLPGVTKQAVETHEEFATLALGGIILLGSVSLGGLAAERSPRTRKAFAAAVLLCAMVSSGLLIRTAQLGGQIRHTELRPGGAVQNAQVAGWEREGDDDDRR